MVVPGTCTRGTRSGFPAEPWSNPGSSVNHEPGLSERHGDPGLSPQQDATHATGGIETLAVKVVGFRPESH